MLQQTAQGGKRDRVGHLHPLSPSYLCLCLSPSQVSLLSAPIAPLPPIALSWLAVSLEGDGGAGERGRTEEGCLEEVASCQIKLLINLLNTLFPLSLDNCVY